MRVFVSGAEYKTAKVQGGIDYARQQREFAEHRLKKVKQDIDEEEALLAADGIKEADYNEDDYLMDLYDEEMYLTRFIKEMNKQETHLRTKFADDLRQQHADFKRQYGQED